MADHITLPLLSPEQASPAARALLEEAQRALGFVPNMYSAMANNPALLGAYLDGYNRFRALSGLTPMEQEVVLLTVSRDHGCEYCMAAHSFIAERVSQVPEQILRAIRDSADIPDPRLSALSEFTTVMVQTRGRPSTDDATAFLAAGFDERAMLAVVTGIGVKVLSNFTNHLFHTETDAIFSAHAWAPQGASST